MSFTHWLSSSLGLSPRPACRRKTPAARPIFRPTLESLEDRWMPSTLTVLNNLDSGSGSLRADIAAAHNGDTIVFAPSLVGQTITLTSGELLINKNLTITGPGAGHLTVSGNNASRVFKVAKGVKDTLSGLTISNGLANGVTEPAYYGGGILNYGTLTVNAITLSDNFARSAGGGIYNYGNLTVSNCTLSGNSAGGGGGIANNHAGTLTVSNSTLCYNTSPMGFGGGINNDGPATITNSTLSHNSAASGGAMSTDGPMTISGDTLSDNAASNRGGGIFSANSAYYNPAPLVLSGTTLLNNSAFVGGGIYDFNGTVTLQSGTILSGNSATYGGGIYNLYGTLTISSSTLSNNTASSAGGGIYVKGPGTVTVKNSSSITGNTSPVGFGADVYNLGVLKVDSTSISMIGVIDGNPAIPI
jgi:parallel beta-helix repeat protein